MRWRFILTYEDDGVRNDGVEQSPADAFDREHFAHVRNAFDVLNEAEAHLRELQEAAAAENIADPDELDVFIGMDHPDDGFATTHNTAAEEQHHIRTASARPRILT